MTTLKAFVRKHKIRAAVEWADRNPNMSSDDWTATAHHYKVTLHHGRKRLSSYFSMGPALAQEPTAEDVLNSLALDSAGFDNSRSFEDWCGEYGYDTDSRRADRTYKIVQRQRDKLAAFLGPELFEELLYKTESL